MPNSTEPDDNFQWLVMITFGMANGLTYWDAKQFARDYMYDHKYARWPYPDNTFWDLNEWKEKNA